MEQIAQSLNQKQLMYLQQEVFPKLDGAVTNLIDYLIETNEPQKYLKQKRIQMYQNLYIQQEDARNKGRFELGSDYNEESDDDFKNAEMAFEEFESLNMQHLQELEQIKDSKYVYHTIKNLDKQRLFDGSPTKNQKAKNNHQKRIEQLQQEGDSDYDSSELEDSYNSHLSNSKKYIKGSVSHSKQKQNQFNPLQFLAEQLKKEREWERLREEEDKVHEQMKQEQLYQKEVEQIQKAYRQHMKNKQEFQQNNTIKYTIQDIQESPLKIDNNGSLVNTERTMQSVI